MQSLVIYLKRTALLAFLAVLGYGVGAVLQPADTSAEETHCDQEYCTSVTTGNPNLPDFKVCMANAKNPNIGKHCKNSKAKGGEPHSCDEFDCPGGDE